MLPSNRASVIGHSRHCTAERWARRIRAFAHPTTTTSLNRKRNGTQNVACRHSQHHRRVGEFVALAGLFGEMPGQHPRDLLDALDDAVLKEAGAAFLFQDRTDLFPTLGTD